MSTMTIRNNDFIENGRGITASHCSMNVDFNGNYCKRYGNETIWIEHNQISRSNGAGLFINSYAYSSTIPYSLMMNLLETYQVPTGNDYDPSLIPSIIAEVNYTLINNQLIDNGDFGSIVLYDHSLYENGDMQRSSLQLTPGYLMSSAIGTNYPSNTNLFHWNIQNCTLESNRNGGVDIRLPYTWLYNENFTHTVDVRDCRFERNKNFEFVIGGHYAKVNIRRNKFLENSCKMGLISITGMEKLMRIEENQIWDNYVQRFVLELNMASHADKFGVVTASVWRNVIRNNRYAGMSTILRSNSATNSQYSPETYAIAIRGVQQVNVTRNILSNRNLQFELLAGVRAGSLYNELDARENWWGVGGDPSLIRERIFDFDDWNSFASVLFSPWLSTERIDGPFTFEQSSSLQGDEDSSFFGVPYLGGRLTKSLVLTARDRPYIVNSDLTIMPGVTLTIRPGVVIEFYPSVGILVLGDLSAIGMQKSPIILRPFRRNKTLVARTRTGEEDLSFRLGNGRNDQRNRRLVSQQPHSEQLVFSKSSIGGVRLCLTETCTEESEKIANQNMERMLNRNGDSGYLKPHNSNVRRHGFLEIYNTTTLQWAPICDTRFTERNAQVVCRQIGLPAMNVYVRRGSRPDMDATLMTRIDHWPDALECTGSEQSLSDCELRTFSKDASDRKAATYESAPFIYSNIDSSIPVLPKNTYRKYIFDNETQEILFYLNDDWTVLEERTVMKSTGCRHDGTDFIYIICGNDNNNQDDSIEGDYTSEHWGGVRFALAAFEEPRRSYGPSSTSNVNNKPFSIAPKSRMQFVHVNGAGILHGEKNAAIQMIQRSIPLEFVTVQRSASNGIEVIAPPDSLSMHQLKVKNNLGVGLNLLLLGASSSESNRVPYQPLDDGPSFTIPYNAFSLVDICDARKELRVGEKMIVYYKYDNRPVDCVKIFTSANPLKRIGLRFLQLNLWSTFVEPDGKSGTRRDDYLQGSKFIRQDEDIFHNKLYRYDGANDQSQWYDESSYIDLSLLNSMSDSIFIWDGDIFNETTRRLLSEVYSDSTRNVLYDSKVSQHHTVGRASSTSRMMMRSSRYVHGKRQTIPENDGVKQQQQQQHQHQQDSKTRLYKSTGYSLSIQLHASGASARYGFVAEITTLPSAYYADRAEQNLQHNITYSEIVQNSGGALSYRSVGESVPPLALLHNIISHNCRQAWANFSTCETNTMHLQLQNTRKLYFLNNMITGNRAGGLHIEASSFTAASALSAELTNNLFSDNVQREALYFEGGPAGHSYQNINVNRNYFTRNRSPHYSNIVFGRAVVKFHENIILNNYGDSQMFVAGFEHAQSSSSLQQCTRNFFYNNHASNERGEQSTIIVSTIGQVYTENYLVNPDNNFELSTRNRTIVTTSSLSSLRQTIMEPTAVAAVLASAIVQAPNNWWGFNETSAIEARIRDSKDYYHLIPVQFKPFYTGNWSVLSGSCYGGYEKIGDTCFVYVGGRMTFVEARTFCEMDNSSMPFVRVASQSELTRYVYMQQPYFDRRRNPVWVQSFDVAIGACSVLVDGYIRVHDCNDHLPFLCERDPEIGVSMTTLDFWYQETLGIAAIAISLVTAILSIACISCWICKSRHRHMEKLERRNSIRASIRSSRSMASMNTINSDGAHYFTNRKIQNDSIVTDDAALTLVNTNSALQRSIQSQPHYSSTHISNNPNIHGTNGRTFGINGSISSASTIFGEHDIIDGQRKMKQRQPPYLNRMNGQVQTAGPASSSNINLIMRPTFDLMFENQAFKGQSTPISPASYSSRDSQQQQQQQHQSQQQVPNRTWTPETNSTLDYKMRPSIQEDVRDLSQYTNSTDNIHKSIPSSASSQSSELTTPPPPPSQHVRHVPSNQSFGKGNRTIRAPIHPPPPPPTRYSIRNDQTAQHRKSMDPTLLLHEKDETLDPGRELLTFAASKNVQPRKQQPQQLFTTDLDSNIVIGGSQPSLIDPYGYRATPPSISTQDAAMHYLETSLDGESFYRDDDKSSINEIGQQQSETSSLPQSHQLFGSQPLETAM
ncbi:hypothetical protein BLOT_011554 [Blomia tropicalis]|nr:hypothetical protein BLOT_011554 [Blomia tropicalis]